MTGCKEERADVYSKISMTMAVFKKRNESQRKGLSLWGRRSATNGLGNDVSNTKLENRSGDPKWSRWPEDLQGTTYRLRILFMTHLG